MTPCLSCQRHRVKLEEHLAAEGLIECKASSDAAELMAVYTFFAVHQRASVPFEVSHLHGSPIAAWPFLFHPSTIDQCAGFLPVADVAAVKP